MAKKSNPSKTGGKGASRMREFGYRAVTVWLDPAEAKAIEAAAEAAGYKVATWIRKLAFEAACSRPLQR